MAFFETEGGSSAVNCVGCAFSERKGNGSDDARRGRLENASSAHDAIEPNVSVFFRWRSSFPIASSGSSESPEGEGRRRGHRRESQKRAETSVHVRPRHPALCVCFPTRAPGGRPSDPPSSHPPSVPLSPPARRGAWARRASWHRPRRSCVCRPASRPTRDRLARLLGSVRQASRAREWRDR